MCDGCQHKSACESIGITVNKMTQGLPASPAKLNKPKHEPCFEPQLSVARSVYGLSLCGPTASQS